MKASEWIVANRIIGNMKKELENLQVHDSNGTATKAKRLTSTITKLVNARNVLSEIADDLISGNIKKTRTRSGSGSYQSGGDGVYDYKSKSGTRSRYRSRSRTSRLKSNTIKSINTKKNSGNRAITSK